MKRRLIELAGLLLLLGFLGIVVVASGVVPVRASAGHWPITRAFLSFAMRRSVETHAIGTHVPDLRDPALVLRGAGHYDRACLPCHGAPGASSSRVMAELTPHPPYMPDVVQQWEPAELFQIVKHGIKMTGMPAWPARERDDEVWAVVAFLVRLPHLDPEQYRQLASAADAVTAPNATSLDPLAPPDDVVATCVQCHGHRGRGRGVGAFPRIAGQSPTYLAAALAAYAEGERHSGIMEPVAASLDEEAIMAIARYYGGGRVQESGGAEAGGAESGGAEAGAPEAGAPEAARADSVGAPLLSLGERIAMEGIPARKVPSCSDCHGPGVGPRNPYYPALAGQYAAYLELQLRLFREERRGGSKYSHIMREVTHSLEPEEAEAVAAWYASLPWDGH